MFFFLSFPYMYHTTVSLSNLAMCGHRLNMPIATNWVEHANCYQLVCWNKALMAVSQYILMKTLWGITRFGFHSTMTRFICVEPCFSQQTPYKYTLNPCHSATFGTLQLPPISKFNMQRVLQLGFISAHFTIPIGRLPHVQPLYVKKKGKKSGNHCLQPGYKTKWQKKGAS